MLKYILYVISVIIFSMSAISCDPKPVMHTTSPTAGDLFVGDRSVNKARSTYMRSRVVSVLEDCELKKEVTTFSIEKAGKVLAILGAGTEAEKSVLLEKNPSTVLDGAGTGVVLRSYEDASYIVTAEHVISLNEEQRDKGLEKFFNCKIYIHPDAHISTTKDMLEVQVSASSEELDLAILKVNGNLNTFSELATDPFVGEEVWSSGYARERADPSNTYLSTTKGVLASVFVSHKGLSTHRVTSQIFSGNSGGPIWDVEGKLVGITLFMFGSRVDEDTFIPFEGAYYIRPASYIKALAISNKIYSEVFRD